MKTTGPNHWTRPPASQRHMLSERMPLVADQDRAYTPLEVASFLMCLVVGALFWTAVFAWWLS